MSAPAAAAAPQVAATTAGPGPVTAGSGPAPAATPKAAPAPDGKDAKAATPTATTTAAAAPNAAPVEKGPRVFVGNLAFKTTSEQLKAHMTTASPNVVSAEIISYASGRSKGCGLVEFKSIGDADKAIKNLTNSELDGRKIFVREDREPKGFGKKDIAATKSADGKSPTRPAAAASAASAAVGEHDGGREGGREGGRGRGGRGRGRGSSEFQSSGRGGRARGRGRGSFGGGGGGSAAGSSDYQPAARPQNTDVTNLYVGNLAWATTDSELKDLFKDFGNVTKCAIATDRSGRSKGFATVAMQRASDAQAAIAGLNDIEFHERKIVVRMDHYA